MSAYEVHRKQQLSGEQAVVQAVAAVLPSQAVVAVLPSQAVVAVLPPQPVEAVAESS